MCRHGCAGMSLPGDNGSRRDEQNERHKGNNPFHVHSIPSHYM